MDREFKISEALGKVLRVSHPALPTKEELAKREQKTEAPGSGTATKKE